MSIYLFADKKSCIGAVRCTRPGNLFLKNVPHGINNYSVRNKNGTQIRKWIYWQENTYNRKQEVISTYVYLEIGNLNFGLRQKA
jgi:hypothetical protein